MDGSISVHELVKTYKGDVKAVQGVSFEVGEGEFFAFLGPNGAGKSTTVQILTTLVKPTTGTIRIGGVDVGEEPERVRWNIGVALQETGIDPVLTGRELIEMQARLFGFTKKEAKTRADELLTLVDLNDAADRPCGKYSGGMRRRLDLALTLVHKPKILFLDEPTTGLDPSNRQAIWKEIKRLNREEGTTIFLTTQYLEEADQLADRISIINQGKIVASGSAEELKRTLGFDAIQLVFEADEEAERASKVLADLGENIECSKDEVTLYTENGTQLLSELVRKLDENNLSPKKLNVKPPSLDDVFINVTNEQKERA
ncbi:ATP-binding cassette domain-containing protein [Guptibacillus hwajinpoensis]|uniref:ATP-binding cassette domain-containing protein n=1 Tax=Guptibacillus hwajinpoensis TaxID=208199 RepID=UPI001CFF3642|nr:ATP-binding cassette domain-containing protein [Pseudalkalibacillus hwajinpoensis]